jgi:hypothetical protein
MKRILKMWRVAFLLAVLLAACGKADVDVQMMDPPEATALHDQQGTQTPNADNFLFYEHEQTRLYFLHPAAWAVQEDPGRITVSGDNLRLMIGYRTSAPDPMTPPAQPADPPDVALVESDPVNWLDEARPTYLDDATRRLYYTSPDNPLLVANMAFSIWLEADEWPLLPSSRQLADKLVESFGLQWLVTRPSADQIAAWTAYTDEATGLQFSYPPEWQVIRNVDAIIVANTVAQLTLVLNGGPTGLPAGELRKGDPTHVWVDGTAVPRVHLVLDGRVKAVYYGPPITPVTIGERQIIISVIDRSPTHADYETVDLPAEILRQMDWIVTTLHS